MNPRKSPWNVPLEAFDRSICAYVYPCPTCGVLVTAPIELWHQIQEVPRYQTCVCSCCGSVARFPSDPYRQLREEGQLPSNDLDGIGLLNRSLALPAANPARPTAQQLMAAAQAWRGCPLERRTLAQWLPSPRYRGRPEGLGAFGKQVCSAYERIFNRRPARHRQTLAYSQAELLSCRERFK